MNALSQFGQQIRELFSSMTPAARVMAGLMLGVILVSLGWMVSAESSSQYESLLGGVSLSHEELDRMETAFGDAQLRDFHRQGSQMRIPTGQKDQYLKALSAAGALPKEWGSEVDRALKEGNVFESSEKFSARYQTSRERELANILKRMPGIVYAAVEYDEQRQGFARQTDKTCSIHVQGQFNDAIPEKVLKRIAESASTFFAGLPESNITVLDLGTAALYRKSDDPNGASENPMLAAQQQWEDFYYAKVSSVLEEYGAVKLMVNVELDPTLSEEMEKLQYDPTAVTLQSTESRKDSENAKAAPSGPPGADINGIGNKPQSLASTAAGQSSKIKESEANERRVAGHDVIRTRSAPLVPTSVKVNIGIPESHYREVLAHRFLLKNPDQTVDDMQAADLLISDELKAEIEGSVRAAVEGVAVGIRDGDSRKPYINVHSYVDLPVPEFPAPTMTAQAWGWLSDSWSTLALMALVLLSLGMMYQWVRSQTVSEGDQRFAEGFGLEIPANMGDELELSGTPEEQAEGRTKPTFDITGSEMKEDLSTLIKDNPDAVVNLLKSWIGDAA